MALYFSQEDYVLKKRDLSPHLSFSLLSSAFPFPLKKTLDTHFRQVSGSRKYGYICSYAQESPKNMCALKELGTCFLWDEEQGKR